MPLKKIGVLVALIAAFAATRVLQGQTANAEVVAAIVKIENDSIKADLAGDTSWAEKYLADDWMGCDSSGKWFTKTDVLTMLTVMATTQNNKYASEKITNLKVRVYGSTAIATYRNAYAAMVQGQQIVRTILGTDVFVKMGTGWKQVSSHATLTK